MTGAGPVLVALSGLPGVGKTTIARALAMASGATLLRIDAIEQAIRSAGFSEPGSGGYAVAYGLAAENLALGHDVIADSVNPMAITREAFAASARQGGGRLLDVEVICADLREHRRRVEGRVADRPGSALPDSAAVLARGLEPWTEPRVLLDTSRRSVGEAVGLLLTLMRD